MAEITLGNLYQANCSIMKTIKPVPEKRMKLDLAGIGAWMSSFPETRYFMLMCKERSDFTLIHLNDFNYLKAVDEIQEILEERGTLLAVDYIHGENHYECWVRQEGETPEQSEVFMFMLFDADWMIVEV